MAGFSDPALLTRLCWDTRPMLIPGEGIITLICTERYKHPGQHYDQVFCLEWSDE